MTTLVSLLLVSCHWPNLLNGAYHSSSSSSSSLWRRRFNRHLQTPPNDGLSSTGSKCVVPAADFGRVPLFLFFFSYSNIFALIYADGNQTWPFTRSSRCPTCLQANCLTISVSASLSFLSICVSLVQWPSWDIGKLISFYWPSPTTDDVAEFIPHLLPLRLQQPDVHPSTE